MRKFPHFLLFSLLVIICLTSCKRTNFTIKGVVPSAKEGDTVFLQQRKGNFLETVDTCLVHNGTFSFSGYQDSIMPHAITYANGEEDYFIPFVIEPGVITIKLDEPFHIGGTPLNERLQAYYSRLYSLQKQLDFYSHRIPPYTYLNRNSALIIAKIKKLKENCQALVYKTIRENIQNPISIILLLRDNYLLDSPQIEELTDMLPKHIQQLPKIKNLQRNSIEDNVTALGKVFIDFTLPNLAGKNITLKDVVGTHRLTFIDFWASWCIPCCKDLPKIEALYKKYKKQNLTIIGISLDTDFEDWHSAVYKYHLTYPQVSDLEGFNSEVTKRYNIRSIPRNYLINQNGTIVGKDIPTDALEEALKHEFNSLTSPKK